LLRLLILILSLAVAAERDREFFQTETLPIVLRRFGEAIEGLGLPVQCDLLSIDVEGHELNVLESIPLDRYSFRAVVVETHLFDAKAGVYKWRHRDLTRIEQLLAKHGYSPAHRSWLNTIYLHSTGGGVVGNRDDQL
jgi:hypothetical protein